MAYYELNGKKIYVTDKVNTIPQQYVTFQPMVQPQFYPEAYIQPQQIFVPSQPNVYVKTIVEKESEESPYEYEHHESVEASDCKCEFCHNLKCDCHSCNPRRYCKCFYCEKLQDNNQKIIIKKDFLPSEQIQKDLPMTKTPSKKHSSREIVMPKTSNKSWYMN